MFDVASRLLQIERRNLVARQPEVARDALVERLVGGEAELMGQLGLTEQDEGDERSGIHLLIEQETKLIEELGGEQMALVDDEQNVAPLAGEFGQGTLQLGLELEKVVGGLDLESEQDLAVERRDRQMRVGKVDDVVDVAVERLSEGAQSGSTQSPVDLPVPTSPVMRAGRHS